MSSSSDYFSTSTDTNGYYQENSDASYTTDNSSVGTYDYDQPEIENYSSVKVSWDSVDYGGTTVNDALF